MGKSEKKKRHAQKPFCYYCDRVFNGEDELVNHQVNKHFKCPECPKKLNTAQGLWTHAHNVHKVNITEVPGARAGRESMDIEIFGMNGVPEGLKPGEEVEDPSKRPKTLPVGPSSAPPPPPHPNMMMNAYSHYPVRPPPMPPGYGGYPPHYPPPHAMGHMHHPPPPHYYPPPQQLSYPPHGPPPGYTYPPPAAGPGGGGAGGGAGGGGGGPAPYFTRGAPPPGFTPPTLSTLSSVGAGGGGPQVNSISPVGVQGPPQPTRAPLFVGTAGYRPPLSSTDQAHLPSPADGGGGGEGEGGKGPDEAEARGSEGGLINDGYGAAPVPNDFQVMDGNCETWQGQVQISNLGEKIDQPANLGGLTKVASFKRSSSLREGLRVQEKEEEPEVVVPSITPSLQELEEAFEHEMTS